jgi:uncharacterized membrane protein YebE (DUF533 family)
MNNKTIAIVAGLAAAGAAGYVGYKILKSKKETEQAERFHKQTVQDFDAICARTIQMCKEHEAEMARINTPRVRDMENHEELTVALAAARKAGQLEHKARVQILTDMVMKKITSAEAVLRLNAKHQETVAAKAAVTKAQKRVPRLRAVA